MTREMFRTKTKTVPSTSPSCLAIVTLETLCVFWPVDLSSFHESTLSWEAPKQYSRSDSWISFSRWMKILHNLSFWVSNNFKEKKVIKIESHPFQPMPLEIDNKLFVSSTSHATQRNIKLLQVNLTSFWTCSLTTWIQDYSSYPVWRDDWAQL